MMAGFLVGAILGFILCLPVGAAIAALFLWLACKMFKEERPYIDAFKAAISLCGIMYLVNIPLKFIDSPWVLLVELVLGGAIGAGVYSNMLGVEPGKAFLLWLTQQGMLLMTCMIIVGPILLATGGLGMITDAMNRQMAQGPDPDDEIDEGPVQPASNSPAKLSPTPEKPAELPSPQPPQVPEPAADTAGSTEPTPAPAPTPEAPAPTPEPSPATAPDPPAPTPTVPPPVEVRFPPGLQGDAQRAFHEDRIADGNNFLRAALLSSEDNSLWNNVSWCQSLERPVIGLRWGIALQMAEPPPVVPQREGTGGQSAPAQQTEAATTATGDAIETDEDLSELRKFTGEIGPKLMAALPKDTMTRLLGPLGEGVKLPKGVQFVGVGTDLRAATMLAREKGVDVLLIAVVSFKVYGVNRNVDASLTLRLIDVATEKRLWTSKTLSSNQMKAALTRGQDPSKDMVRSLTEYLEVNFHLADKPNLDNVKARQKAEVLARQETTNPLPALVEVRYYQIKGLLTPMQVEQCFQQLIDSEGGSLLVNGGPEERRRVLDRFLPRTRS